MLIFMKINMLLLFVTLVGVVRERYDRFSIVSYSRE